MVLNVLNVDDGCFASEQVCSGRPAGNMKVGVGIVNCESTSLMGLVETALMRAKDKRKSLLTPTSSQQMHGKEPATC